MAFQNPFAPNYAPGFFGITTLGYKQGDVQPDVATRWQLSSGNLAITETLPMWGGIAIIDYVPAAINSVTNKLGTASQPASGNIGLVARATLTSQITGFSTNDNSFAAVQTTQSPVPLIAPGNGVNFYRLGSNARLMVAIDTVLAASLNAGTSPINTQVSWDFTGEQLVQYAPFVALNAITAMSWASTSGGTVTATTTSAHGLVPGSRVPLAGFVPDAYNGDVTAIAGTTGSTLKYLLPAASTPGTVTTLGTILAEGGALPVKVLAVNVGNSLVVAYNQVTGVATWNTSGSVAVIQL